MPEWLVTPTMWNDIFVVGSPVIEKILRPIIVYIFLVTALRVFGKRELAQLNPFDLVVLLSLSNTVQNAIIGNDNSLTGRLDQIFEGKPTVLVENGCVKEKALAKELLTRSELTTVLHRQGFDSVAD